MRAVSSPHCMLVGARIMCDAVGCSVLQCVAVCPYYVCNTLQPTATHYNTLQYTYQ